MPTKELDHSLQLIVALSRVDEEAVVASSFVVTRLDCFLMAPQRRFKVTRQGHIVIWASAAGGFSRAMQDVNRHVELSGAGSRSQSIAGGVKNDGLHVASRQEVLQDGSAAAGVPDERQPIRVYAGQRTRRFRQGIDEQHCFRIVAGAQGRNLWTRNRWSYRIRTGAAAT